MKQSQFPPGWDNRRVQNVIAFYEAQTEEEAVAEDEAALQDQTQTVMEIPTELVPVVRELIAKHYGQPNLTR
ncbi:MAG: hypothetical protein KDI73_03975 [Candidatus Competibacteraceae bacterium]|nr:hypothetical protein [Candidatus Competibacteraceae bacterium]